MNEHTEHVHTPPEAAPPRPPVVVDSVNDPGLPRISWGAIFAGLVVVLSLGWLLHLLGVAFGVSVADATDSYNMQGGLAVGASLWIVISWLVAFFIGALVTARLAGRIDEFSGMLHGLTLWGVATLATLVLAYMGISALLQTGQQLASTAVSGVSTVAVGTGEALAVVPEGANAAADALTSQWGRNLRDRLADEAARMAASTDRQLTPAELRRAIDNLDQRTVRRLVLDLTNDDTEGAAQLLADSTELSPSDADALIDGAYREMEESFGNPDNNARLSEDLENQLARQVDGYIARLDARGGPDVTEQDVRRAIDNLDNQAVQQLAGRLAVGDARGAKRVLAQNTSLTRAQIDDLYEGAMIGIESEAAEYRQALNESVESVSTYAQEVLWVSFAATAMGLLVSLAGGWLGADSSRRVYPRREV